MGLLDIVTGGKSSDAEEAMRKAAQAFEQVKTPTISELTLPELQKYVEAGVMTPAQAKAMLVEKNAYDTMQTPTVGRDAQIAALNRLENIGANGGKDAISEAALQDTINKMNSSVAGQRGAILDSFAQRGVPLSLASMAAQNTYLGQDAAQANSNALQANANAEMRALQALENAGNLGGNIQAQDWNQANTKAAAQNAINQWNSQVANNVANANAGRQQEANAYNTQNRQNVSNANVGTGNYRTEYNAKVPETVFNNNLQKASGVAGAYQNIGNLAQQQGQQQAGIISGLIGAGATLGAGALARPAAAAAGPGTANVFGTQVQTAPANYWQNQGNMGTPFAEGGMVPGHASVPGDSPENDTVPARLSPGEIVIPRSVAQHPSLIHEFISHLPKKHIAPHPEDIANTLTALTHMRHAMA